MQDFSDTLVVELNSVYDATATLTSDAGAVTVPFPFSTAVPTRRLQLVDLYMQGPQLNIVGGWNDTLRFFVSGTQYNITPLDQGYYSGPQLAMVLADAMVAAASSLVSWTSATYNEATKQFSFTFSGLTAAITTDTRLGWQLGFTYTSLETPSPTVNYVPAFLGPPMCMDVCVTSPLGVTGKLAADESVGLDSILATIPTSDDPAYWFKWTEADGGSYLTHCTDTSLQNLTLVFQLRDAFGSYQPTLPHWRASIRIA